MHIIILYSMCIIVELRVPIYDEPDMRFWNNDLQNIFKNQWWPTILLCFHHYCVSKSFNPTSDAHSPRRRWY